MLNLDNECWAIVLKYLDRADLCALALTSPAFRSLAQALLCSDLLLCFVDICRICPAKLRRFLRQPRLLGFARSLTIAIGSPNTQPKAADAKLLELLISQLKQLKKFQASWSGAFERRVSLYGGSGADSPSPARLANSVLRRRSVTCFSPKKTASTT
jgi:hypothetical protein